MSVADTLLGKIRGLSQENQRLMRTIEEARVRQREIQIELTKLNGFLEVAKSSIPNEIKNQVLTMNSIESAEEFGPPEPLPKKDWLKKMWADLTK